MIHVCAVVFQYVCNKVEETYFISNVFLERECARIDAGDSDTCLHLKNNHVQVNSIRPQIYPSLTLFLYPSLMEII